MFLCLNEHTPPYGAMQPAASPPATDLTCRGEPSVDVHIHGNHVYVDHVQKYTIGTEYECIWQIHVHLYYVLMRGTARP